jgi:hypothetical protein
LVPFVGVEVGGVVTLGLEVEATVNESGTPAVGLAALGISPVVVRMFVDVVDLLPRLLVTFSLSLQGTYDRLTWSMWQ